MIQRTREEFISDLWRESAGLSPVKIQEDMPDPDTVARKQWSEEFDRLRHNRMIMGAFRYGFIEEKEYKKADLLREIKKRTDRYDRDGNLEHLLDVGNFVMLAYMHGKKSGQEMITIDDGEHFNG